MNHDFGLTGVGPDALFPYCSCGWIGRAKRINAPAPQIRAGWLAHRQRELVPTANTPEEEENDHPT